MIECGIGGEGAKRIGEMLEKNGSLVELHLFGKSLLSSHSSSLAVICALLADWHPWGSD
jgi:hypothetical protein